MEKWAATWIKSKRKPNDNNNYSPSDWSEKPRVLEKSELSICGECDSYIHIDPLTEPLLGEDRQVISFFSIFDR